MKRRSNGAESVAFDVRKYGRPLGVDVSALPDLGRRVALDPATIEPGHGEVLRDAGYLRRVTTLLDSVITRVNQLVGQHGSGPTLEQAQAGVDLAAARREFAGDDPDNQQFFDASMASLVRLVLAEAKAR